MYACMHNLKRFLMPFTIFLTANYMLLHIFLNTVYNMLSTDARPFLKPLVAFRAACVLPSAQPLLGRPGTLVQDDGGLPLPLKSF